MFNKNSPTWPTGRKIKIRKCCYRRVSLLYHDLYSISKKMCNASRWCEVEGFLFNYTKYLFTLWRFQPVNFLQLIRVFRSSSIVYFLHGLYSRRPVLPDLYYEAGMGAVCPFLILIGSGFFSNLDP